MAAPTLATLLDLERKVWEALRAGDAAADARLLAADFIGVYPSGVEGREGHAAQLAAGPTVAAFEIREPKMIPLGDDAALLIYLAGFHRPDEPETERGMYVSSLWRRRGAGWANIFSQDTPLD
ncbi:nuclear transport factor 2 family protein [Pikeienuella piscinae]|uniref:Nuclear transport factor 2 family protein n=1 Tax=Pikeienuella piscinae TaxID=2748098 RepID=A0A7L5BT27_9RHOB|nr:DUF4440 domain-containing protein [Pikeienuella piscinae]QIE54342.1 nuclear transport factor 2 family protein [Pikeienuella piscinae]